jgi:hypothetical protein
MIYEIRTYNLKPGTVGEFETRFAKGYPTREKYSPLYGFWHTEIGPLNQLVHIWPYENLQQRAEKRAAATKDPSGNWPPGVTDLIVSQESDILQPIKGMTEWKGPQAWGSLYELRMYTFPGGQIGKVAEKFGESLAGRAAIYPIAGVWTSELGNLNRLYQLFPFKDWSHRDEVRAEFRKTGVWPPHTDGHPLHQLVRHLTPAAYSPLH